MERPTSTLGLAVHLVRTRWNALSSRGRMLVAVGAVVTVGLLGAGVHAATSSCCASACPSRAAMHGDCPHSP